MNRPLKALLTLTVVAALAGCGSSNDGGDTTCADFLPMSNSDKDDVIRAYLESKGTTDPAGGDVHLHRMSAIGFCHTIGTDSDPIRKIDG